MHGYARAHKLAFGSTTDHMVQTSRKRRRHRPKRCKLRRFPHQQASLLVSQLLKSDPTGLKSLAKRRGAKRASVQRVEAIGAARIGVTLSQISHYTAVVAAWWEFSTKPITIQQAILGSLYLLQRGLVSEFIPQDGFLGTVLPPVNGLAWYGFAKRDIRVGKNAILEAYRGANAKPRPSIQALAHQSLAKGPLERSPPQTGGIHSPG